MSRTYNFYWLSVILFSLSTATHLATFTPAFQLGPSLPLLTLGIGVFVTFIPAVRPLKTLFPEAAPTNMWKVALAPLTQAHRRFLGLLLAYTAFNFIFTLGYLGGGHSAELREGHYVLMDKSRVLRELTETEFHYQNALTVRGFTGHFMIFQAVSMSLLLAHLRRLQGR